MLGHPVADMLVTGSSKPSKSSIACAIGNISGQYLGKLLGPRQPAATPDVLPDQRYESRVLGIVGICGARLPSFIRCEPMVRTVSQAFSNYRHRRHSAEPSCA